MDLQTAPLQPVQSVWIRSEPPGLSLQQVPAMKMPEDPGDPVQSGVVKKHCTINSWASA